MRFSFRSRISFFLVLLLLLATGIGLLTSFRGVAKAANLPHIWLSQKIGPPTSTAKLNGSGFGQNETVNVNFDAMQIGTATTDTTGKFIMRITVPKTALPGTHTVQATGQSSGLTASTSFLVRTDWAQFGFGPYHTGNNPYENVLSPSNVSTLVLDWTYNLKGPIYSSSPTAANGIVYIGSTDHKLYALDALTGTLKWSYTTGGPIYSSTDVVNGVAYFGSSDDKLYALDAVTGTLKWSYITGNQIQSSPVSANGVVYFGSFDNKLYALGALRGTLKWNYTTIASIPYSAAVANGMVYVGSNNGNNVYAFHLPGMS